MSTLKLPTAYNYLNSEVWKNAVSPKNVAWADVTEQGTSKGYKPFEVVLGDKKYVIEPSTNDLGHLTTSVSGIKDWGKKGYENQIYMVAGLLDPRLKTITDPGYDPTKTENVFDDYLLDMFKRDPEAAIGALGMFNWRANFNAGSGDEQAFSGEYWKGVMGGMQGGASAASAKKFGLDTAANKDVAQWWTHYMSPQEQSKRDDPNRGTEDLINTIAPFALNAALIAAGLPPIAAGAASGGFGAAMSGGDIGKGLLFGGAAGGIGDAIKTGVGGSSNSLNIGHKVAQDIADFGVDATAKAWGVNPSDLIAFGDDPAALATLVGGPVSPSLGSGISPTAGGVTGVTGTPTGTIGSLGTASGSPSIIGNIPGLGSLTAAGLLIPEAGGAAKSISGLSSTWDAIVNAATSLGKPVAEIAKVVGLTNSDGSVNWGKAIGTAASTVGGVLQSQASTDAAKTMADAQIQAAKIAADAAKFKPVGVSTRFGTSNFGYDANGNLTSAGYTVSPELKQLQDSLMQSAPGLLNQFTESMTNTRPMLTGANTMMGYAPNIMASGDRLISDAEQLRPNAGSLASLTQPLSDYARNQLTLADKFREQSMSNMQDSDRFRQQFLGSIARSSATGALGDAQTALGGDYTQLAKEKLAAASPFWDQATGSIGATSGIGAAGNAAIALGQGYLKKTPQEMAAQYMAEQQALLASSRERELSALENRLQQQGRLGLSVGGTSTGMGASNPELEALMNARRQEDLSLAAQATKGGMDYARFGADLTGVGSDLINKMYGTQAAAFSPYERAMAASTNLAASGAAAGSSGSNLLSGMYGIQNSALQPYQGMLNTATGLASAGQSGASGSANLMRDVYGIQSAAYDPYKTALGLGQQQINYGAGLLGTGGTLMNQMYGVQNAAFQPYQTALSGAQTIEGLGQNAMDLGINIGAKGTAANASAGNLLAQGVSGSANTMYQNQQLTGNPWANMLQGLGNSMSPQQQPQQQQQSSWIYNPYTGLRL